MFHHSHVPRALLVLALTCAGLGSAQARADAPGPDQPTTAPAPKLVPLDKIAGGRAVRAVWMQGTRHPLEESLDSEHLQLWGVDSTDGKGPRAILPGQRNCFLPMLTGDGKRVVFTDRPNQTVYVVGFDGKGLRKVASGWALETWTDPDTGRDYALVQMGKAQGASNHQMLDNPVYRLDLDRPKAKPTLVWDRTPVMFNNFQLSRDGKRVAIEAPWPRCVSAELPNGNWRVFGRGCYPMMAPDNSYITAHMDGAHRNLFLFSPTGRTWWEVPVDTVPGHEPHKVHQPRWSNSVRFITLASPHPLRESRESEAGRKIEVYVGRFSEDLKRIEAWAKLSDNRTMDLFPDIWIADADEDRAPKISEPPAEETAVDPAQRWPGHADALQFFWDTNQAENVLRDADGKVVRDFQVVPRGEATFDQAGAMHLGRGRFEVTVDWTAAVKAIQRAGALTVEMVIVPESDGRLMHFGGNTQVPDVGAFHWGDRFNTQLGWRKNERGRQPHTEFAAQVPEPGKAYHILYSVTGKQMVSVVNGELFLRNVELREGDLSRLIGGDCWFGPPPGDQWFWQGRLRSVAVFSRAFTPMQARARYKLVKAHLAKTPQPQRLTVRAKLAHKIDPPAPKDIDASYRRALLVSRYEVVEVLKGKWDADTIDVAQWALLDREVTHAIKDKRVGEPVVLHLETFLDDGALKSEWKSYGPHTDVTTLWYDPSRDEIDRRTPAEKLRDAIWRDDLDEVRKLIKTEPKLAAGDVPISDSDRTEPAIDVAAATMFPWHRHAKDIYAALISAGAKPTLRTHALAGHREEVIEILSAAPARVNEAGPDGRSLLHVVGMEGPWVRHRMSMARLLMERGATHDVFTAARFGKPEALKKILAASSAVAKATGPGGYTPLHWVTFVNDPERKADWIACTKLLLAAGADPNARWKDWDHYTPLHTINLGAVEQIDLLIDAGADMNALSSRNQTPLDSCIRHQGPEQAKRLRQLGAKTGRQVLAERAATQKAGH